MSTPVVPAKNAINSGAKADNKKIQDKTTNEIFQPGCWAETSDALTYLIIDDIVDKNVIFRGIDIGTGKFVHTMETMDLKTFAKRFSDVGLIWHDKSPIPWDKIMSPKDSKKSISAFLQNKPNEILVSDIVEIRAKLSSYQKLAVQIKDLIGKFL